MKSALTKEQIELKYFDGEYTEVSNREKLDIVGYELLRLEDEIDELREKQKDMETLYDILKPLVNKGD